MNFEASPVPYITNRQKWMPLLVRVLIVDDLFVMGMDVVFPASAVNTRPQVDPPMQHP